MLRLAVFGLAATSGALATEDASATCAGDWVAKTDGACPDTHVDMGACPAGHQRKVPGDACHSGYTLAKGEKANALDGCVCEEVKAIGVPKTEAPATVAPTTEAPATVAATEAATVAPTVAPTAAPSSKSASSKAGSASKAGSSSAGARRLSNKQRRTRHRGNTARQLAAHPTCDCKAKPSAAEVAAVVTEIVQSAETKVTLSMELPAAPELLPFLAKAFAKGLYDQACSDAGFTTAECYATVATAVAGKGYSVKNDGLFAIDSQLATTGQPLVADITPARRLAAVSLTNGVTFSTTYTIDAGASDAAKVAASGAMTSASAATKTKMHAASTAAASMDVSGLATAIGTQFAAQVAASDLSADLKTAAVTFKAATLDTALAAMTVEVAVATPTTTTASAPAAPAASSAAEFSMAGFVLAVGSLLF